MLSEHILVIGGTEPELSILKQALRSHELIFAASWQEARTALEFYQSFSIVIIDMRQSVKEDLLILRELKSHPEHKNLYTVCITQEDEPDTDYLALHAGADDTIHTPLGIDEVEDIVLFSQTRDISEGFLGKTRDKEMLLNALLWRSPIGIAISHGTAVIGKEAEDSFIVNTMFEKITGWTKDEIRKLGWTRITHPDDLEEELRNYRQLLAGEVDSYTMEKRYVRPDGTSVWANVMIASIEFTEPEETHQVCLIQDISKRKKAEEALSESERSKSVLLSNLPGMAYRCLWDRDWTMHYASPASRELTGYEPEEFLFNRDLAFNDIIAPEYRDLLWNAWETALETRSLFREEYEIIKKSGERRWVVEIGQGVFSSKGDVEALEGIILDITDRKNFEDSLQYHNDHDIRTGLYNHSYFEQYLREELQHIPDRGYALISVDISSVYTLSRRYGFQYSQAAVQKAAQSLKKLSTGGIKLFRAYESHFAFSVPSYGSREELRPLLEKIYEKLERIFSIERIGWGVGVIEIDRGNTLSVEQLLRNLLIASEKSLDSFSEQFEFCFFDDTLTKQIDREELIAQELYEIISGKNPDRLFLEFQAIYHLQTCAVVGFEALARLSSGHFGHVPPLEFIPVAEKTKLIIPLGEMIFRKACIFLRKLKEQGLPPVRISVNVSPIQIFSPGFTEAIFDIMKETGVAPEQLGIEITESIVANNFVEVNRVLGELKNRGIYVSLDDFGTGYSSLARERDLNVTCIKIDKSFIDRLRDLHPSSAITGDIVSMAHKLGHCCVAEGVEEEMQFSFLKDVGCDMVQGYLISHPLPSEAAAAFLLKSRRNGGLILPCGSPQGTCSEG